MMNPALTSNVLGRRRVGHVVVAIAAVDNGGPLGLLGL